MHVLLLCQTFGVLMMLLIHGQPPTLDQKRLLFECLPYKVHPPIHLVPFDVITFAQHVRRLPVKKATGIDGWRNRDLCALPTEQVASLAAMFVQFESRGLLPKLLTCSLIVLLRKDPVSTDPLKQRPITILCNLYSLWSGFRAAQFTHVMLTRLPSSTRGGLPADACACAWELRLFIFILA